MSRVNRLTLTALLTLIAVPLFPPASAQSKTTGNPSLEARVQRLEDLEEIRTVLTDYGRLLDARDFHSYSHLFAKDGEWIGGLGEVQGPVAIQRSRAAARVENRNHGASLGFCVKWTA